MTLESDLSLLVTRTSAVINKQEDWINAEIKLSTGTATDPDSFNAAGGKTGDLGYYPIKNANGVTVYMPCLERMKLVLDASRSLLIANSYPPASLKTALAAALDITFQRGAKVTMTALSQQLVQIANGTIDLNGGEILADFSDLTNTGAMSLRNVKNGTLRLAAGRNIHRFVGFSTVATSGIFENLDIVSVDQVANSNDNDDAALRLLGTNARVKNVKISNFDIASRVYGANASFEDVTFSNYVKGLLMNSNTGFRGRNLIFESMSPNGNTDPGHNAIGGGGCSDVEIIGGRIGFPGVRGSGEHGVYLACETGSEGVSVRFSDFTVFSPGQCGFKFRAFKELYLSNCHARDMSTGNAIGTNEDGFRTERCIGVQMIGCSSGRVVGSSGGYHGQIIVGSQKVNIRNHVIRDSISHGLSITDITSGDGHGPDMASGDIYWDGEILNAGAAGIYFSHTSVPIMGDIIINARINGAAGPPVDLSGIGSIAAGKKIIIRGYYRSCGAAAPSSSAQIDLSGLIAL